MILSDRLTAIVSMAPAKSRCVADIGTDHGFVPIALVEQGAAEQAIAMDIRTGPLKRAQDHIREKGLEHKIETRLSDGLDKLEPGQADLIIIAGMGGELIIHILTEGKRLWDSVDTLILSPQSDLDKVRLFLEGNGFVIAEETMLREDGKYYVVMKVRRGTMTYKKYIYYKYGKTLIESGHPVLAEYLEKEKKTCLGILCRLAINDTERARARQEAIQKELLLIEEAKTLMADRRADREEV